MHYSKLSKYLSEDQMKKLQKKSHTSQFNQGTILIQHHQEVSEIFCIVEGFVIEKNGKMDDPYAPYIKHQAGDIVGLQTFRMM